MRKGDLVRDSQGHVGMVLGFSIDFLIHRYDINEYRILWQKGQVSENVSAKCLTKIS